MILGVLFKFESVTFRIHFEINRPVLSLFVHVPRLITPGRLYPFPNTLYQEQKIILICNYLMIFFCQNFLWETDGNRWNFRLGCDLTYIRNQLSLCERAGFWICLTSESHLMSLTEEEICLKPVKHACFCCISKKGKEVARLGVFVSYEIPFFCFTLSSLLNKVTHKFCYNGIIYLILLHSLHSYILCVSPWPFFFSCPLSYF